MIVYLSLRKFILNPKNHFRIDIDVKMRTLECQIWVTHVSTNNADGFILDFELPALHKFDSFNGLLFNFLHGVRWTIWKKSTQWDPQILVEIIYQLLFIGGINFFNLYRSYRRRSIRSVKNNKPYKIDQKTEKRESKDKRIRIKTIKLENKSLTLTNVLLLGLNCEKGN